MGDDSGVAESEPTEFLPSGENDIDAESVASTEPLESLDIPEPTAEQESVDAGATAGGPPCPPLLWRHVGHHSGPLDTLRLVPAFGTVEAVTNALNEVEAMLNHVSEQESEALLPVANGIAQFLLIVSARNSRENGQRLLEHVRALEHSLALRASWPTDGDDDPRQGSVLEGVDNFIFEHETEGLIRLQFKNPLPKPGFGLGGGIQCDVCYNQDLQLAYQHVTEDNERDNSTFILHRVGFDVCFPCAEKRALRDRERFCRWLGTVVAPGRMLHFERPSVANGAPLELSLRVLAFGPLKKGPIAHGELTLEVDVRGTAGLYAAVAAVPMGQDAPDVIAEALPASWTGTGTAPGATARDSVAPSAQEPLVNTDTELHCLSGAQYRITLPPKAGARRAERRGVLMCSPCVAPDEWGEAVPFRALSFSERLVQEADADLAPHKPGDKVPYISFQGSGLGVWLSSGEQATRALRDLRLLASRCAVAHNLPRESLPACTSSSSSPRSPATAPGDGSCVGKRASPSDDPNTCGGLLVSADWARLGDCMICLDSLSGATWLRGAPLSTRCGHFFHMSCLRKYARGHESTRCQGCPNCRTDEPLRDAKHVQGDMLHLSLSRDALGREFQADRYYRVAAVLCQDQNAIVDSALLLTFSVLRPGELPVSSADQEAVEM